MTTKQQALKKKLLIRNVRKHGNKWPGEGAEWESATEGQKGEDGGREARSAARSGFDITWWQTEGEEKVEKEGGI